MRNERTSGIPVFALILPASCADWIGESGGTYQTMGSVRYSGWSGKATFHSIAIFQMGEAIAAISHWSGMPCERASACTAGSCGFRKTPSCAG